MKILLIALLLSSTAIASPSADIHAAHGQLENGLRYYLKPIPASNEVELRLLVNGGSLEEDKGEHGIAHLIEHMAFHRTKHFAKGEIGDLLNQNGMRFVNDSNAFTGHETTSYFLKLKKTSFERGLQLLADWANAEIVFDEAELKTERNVVINELQISRDKHNDWRDYLAVLYPSSAYPKQMPIGYQEDIQNLPLEKIQALYRKLYQPQRISLVIAGDVPADTEQKIKTLFNQTKRGDAPAQYAPQPLAPKTRIYWAQPAPWPQQENAVSWNYKLAPSQDIDSNQLQRIALLCLQQRLEKISTQKDQAIRSAKFVDWTGMVGRERYLTLYAPSHGKLFTPALSQLYREIRRARLNGFSQQEVAEAKRLTNQTLDGLPPFNHTQWANLLLASARLGTAARDLPAAKTWFNSLDISAESVNAAWQLLNATPDQLAIVMPAENSASKEYWDDASLKAIMDKVDAESLPPLADIASKPLLAKEPTPGQISQRQQQENATIYRLSNGAEVLIRPRRQDNERIGISAYFPGGMLALPDKLRPLGILLPKYIGNTGLGELNSSEVSRALVSADLMIEPWVELDSNGFSGHSAASSLPSALQIIHLAMAQPRSDEEAQKMAAKWASERYMKDGGPGANASLFSNWPYRNWWNTDFEQLSTDQLEHWRQQLFTDPSQLKLVLTGVPSMADAEKLLERYIASIPSRNIPTPQLTKLTPAQPTSSGFYKNDFTIWSIAIPEQAINTETAFMAEALADLMQSRLWASLRINAGDSYVVAGSYQLSPSMGLVLRGEYSADKRKCSEAATLTAAELHKLSSLSISDAELKSMQDRMQQGIDNGPNVPYWYAKSQIFHWVNNRDLAWLKPQPQVLLSREKVEQAAKAWFAPNHWHVLTDGCKPDLNALGKPPATTASK